MLINKRYKSIYGAKANSIRPDQYLVELIIKRRADKASVTLPNRFWSKDIKDQYEYWVKIWNHETKYAQILFKKYDPQCVIDAFNSHDCQNVLSANNKQLDKITKEFQRRKDVMDKAAEKVEIIATDPTVLPKIQNTNKSKLSKLK